MKGIQFLVDDSGRKTAVQIDLKEQGQLWEDIFDRAIVMEHADEPRDSLESVKKQVLGGTKRRRNI